MADDQLITVTVKRLVEISGLGITSIYKMLKSGELESATICGRRLIIMDSYRDLVEKQRKRSSLAVVGEGMGERP
jgi:hypothetical protein